MPGYKNRIRSPEYVECQLEDERGEVVGTLRVRPSAVLWKPGKAQRFRQVKLEAFTKWIMSPESGSLLAKW